MQTTKKHTLIVRGVTRNQKHSLKKLAKERKQSVNGFLLAVIESETSKPKTK